MIWSLRWRQSLPGPESKGAESMKNLNQKLISLIREYGEDRTAALKSCIDLDCFMALSPLRENLLEWYEFQEDGELLQVGADYGALTGLFRKRVKAVTVWDESEEQRNIVRERFPDTSEGAPVSCVGGSLKELLQEGKRYDYVVCAGGFKEPEDQWAEILRDLTKPGGTVTAAVCNRFGLKYLAGGKRDEVSLTRSRLSALFPGCTFYYPMPDYRVPSVIYSDRCLPSKGELAGIHTLYDFPEYPSIDVGAEFEAACEDGQFANFADSFLIVWKKGE